MGKLNRTTLFFSITLILLISPIVFIQSTLLHTVFLDGELLKKIIAGIVSISFLLSLITLQKYRKEDIIYAVLFIVFLVYNFYIINVFSREGDDANGAFFYNYSLLIFLYPFYKLASFEKKTMSKKVVLLFAVLILGIDAFGIIQYIVNDYMIPLQTQLYLLDHDYIKFDVLHSHVRSMSIMKSPLEFGMMNALLSVFLFSKILTKNRKSAGNVILFLITSISVFVTISRTAILMLVAGLLVYFIIHMVINRHRGKASIKKRNDKLLLWLSLVFLSTGSVIITYFLFLKNFVSEDNTFLDPTNLLIRLENWIFIITSRFTTLGDYLFGLGIIQNGSYGQSYAVVIDNTYLGALMAGGFAGLTLFLILIVTVIVESLKHTKRVEPKYIPLCVSLISFFVAYLIGGFTENLMHIIFYPFLVIMILKTIPLKKDDLVGKPNNN